MPRASQEPSIFMSGSKPKCPTPEESSALAVGQRAGHPCIVVHDVHLRTIGIRGHLLLLAVSTCIYFPANGHVLLGRSQPPPELDAPSKPILGPPLKPTASSSCGAQGFCARRVAVQHARDLLQLLVPWPPWPTSAPTSNRPDGLLSSSPMKPEGS